MWYLAFNFRSFKAERASTLTGTWWPPECVKVWMWERLCIGTTYQGWVTRNKSGSTDLLSPRKNFLLHMFHKLLKFITCWCSPFPRGVHVAGFHNSWFSTFGACIQYSIVQRNQGHYDWFAAAFCFPIPSSSCESLEESRIHIAKRVCC